MKALAKNIVTSREVEVEVMGIYSETHTEVEYMGKGFIVANEDLTKVELPEVQTLEMAINNKADELVKVLSEQFNIDSDVDYVGDDEESQSVVFENTGKTFSTARGIKSAETITVFVYVDRYEVETFNVEKEYKTGEGETSNRRVIKKLNTLVKWIDKRIG